MAKDKGKSKDKKQGGKKASRAPEVVAEHENKCMLCRESKCCHYVTQELDPPRSMDDFDHLLWQVAHRNVEAFKDEEGWFLMFVGHACVHLQPNGDCGIYETRPRICREHSNDYCEYDEPAEEGFELYFPTYESLDEYCRDRFKGWDKRFRKYPD